MHTLTEDEAQALAAIMANLAQLGAYAGALPWHDGERHEDDPSDELRVNSDESALRLPATRHSLLVTRDWEEPRLLNDELPGYLLSLPRQVAT